MARNGSWPGSQQKGLGGCRPTNSETQSIIREIGILAPFSHLPFWLMRWVKYSDYISSDEHCCRLMSRQDPVEGENRIYKICKKMRVHRALSCHGANIAQGIW